MYNVLSLLLLATAPVNTELVQLCNEIKIEVEIAVERGYINEQVAADIFQRCWAIK